MPGKHSGFTLVEIVTVLVILGIVAAIGSSFLITTVDSYRTTEARAKLVTRGRTAIEQMTRQLRLAAPNSLRVSASGLCLEFFPLVGGANYLSALPDTENAAPLVSSINTAPIILDLGTPEHVIVGALNAGDIYTSGSPAARVQLASLSGSPATTINLATPHRFIRNSIHRRVYLAGDPKRFCVASSSLVLYQAYPFDTSTLTDATPAAAPVIMALEVAASGNAFSLSPGSEDRNAAVNIALIFSGNNESVELNQQVLVRNVP